MKNYYCIAEKFSILVDCPVSDSVGKYIDKQFKDYRFSFPKYPVLCSLYAVSENNIDYQSRELVKDWFYETSDSLLLKFNSQYLHIRLNSETFEIYYPYYFENVVVFHTLEVLVRLYCHKYGIDFFHASSFEYNDTIFMLNGFGGSGKTEIMLDFLLRDASFISDDLLIINENAEIYPYTVEIPIAWRSVTPELADKNGISRRLYDICKYCFKKNGRITRRLFGRLAGKYFTRNYYYRELTPKETDFRYFSIDHCVWLQEANFSGPFSFSPDNLYEYMDLCLTNESRKYFDLEGFILLKYPFVKRFISKRQALRKEICSKLPITGLAVKERDYKTAARILKLQ